MAVLGAMLLGGAETAEKAGGLLVPDDFYRLHHRTIFATMVGMAGRGDPIDIVSLRSELAGQGHLELEGGPGITVAYLMQLGDFVPTVVNMPHYAKIVRRMSGLRRIIEEASRAATLAYAAVEQPDVIAAQLSQAVEGVQEAAGEEKARTLHVGEIIDDGVNDLLDRLESGDTGLRGVPTGFPAIDSLLCGLKPGALILLGARPAMGKSSLGMQIGINAAHWSKEKATADPAAKPGAVLYVSLEMSKEQVNERLLQIEARVDSRRIAGATLDGPERKRIVEAGRMYHTLPFYCTVEPGLKVAEIAQRVRKLRREHGCCLVVVDYLQFVAPEGRRGASREEETGAIGRALKVLARRENVPVVAIASLSRQVEQREDKRPIMSDLRESGSLESDADVVAFLYRPMYYLGRAGGKGGPTPPPASQEDSSGGDVDDSIMQETEVLVRKHRGGPVGTAKVGFTPLYARFDNLREGVDNKF